MVLVEWPDLARHGDSLVPQLGVGTCQSLSDSRLLEYSKGMSASIISAGNTDSHEVGWMAEFRCPP